MKESKKIGISFGTAKRTIKQEIKYWIKFILNNIQGLTNLIVCYIMYLMTEYGTDKKIIFAIPIILLIFNSLITRVKTARINFPVRNRRYTYEENKELFVANDIDLREAMKLIYEYENFLERLGAYDRE